MTALAGHKSSNEDTTVDKTLQTIQPVIGVLGRGLLGLYFLLPGISKIPGFDGTAQYMATHGVPMVTVLLLITIVLQIGGGAALILGWRTRATALMLAAMTLTINVFIHDFWNVYEGLNQAHETQNFVKNLAIMAGLLALAAGPQAMRLSLDQRRLNNDDI